MGSRFVFEVVAELEHVTGKWESRESLGEQLFQELESADPSEVSGENEGTYEVVSWDVNEVDQVKPLSDNQLADKVLPLVEVLVGRKDKQKAKQLIELAKALGIRIQ